MIDLSKYYKDPEGQYEYTDDYAPVDRDPTEIVRIWNSITQYGGQIGKLCMYSYDVQCIYSVLEHGSSEIEWYGKDGEKFDSSASKAITSAVNEIRCLGGKRKSFSKSILQAMCNKVHKRIQKAKELTAHMNASCTVASCRDFSFENEGNEFAATLKGHALELSEMAASINTAITDYLLAKKQFASFLEKLPFRERAAYESFRIVAESDVAVFRAEGGPEGKHFGTRLDTKAYNAYYVALASAMQGSESYVNNSEKFDILLFDDGSVEMKLPKRIAEYCSEYAKENLKGMLDNNVHELANYLKTDCPYPWSYDYIGVRLLIDKVIAGSNHDSIT